METPQRSVRLDEADWRELHDLATLHGRNRSQEIKVAIREHLARHRTELSADPVIPR